MNNAKNKKLIFSVAALFTIALVYFSLIGYKILKKENDKVPKVSVVVPVYNSAEFLPQCLDSIVNQTYRKLEIICVNDGSKDNSLDILRKYKNKDPRFIIIDKPNGGVSSARNAGLKAATGKYVQFIDSDDLINAEAFKNLVEEAETFNADIVTFKKTWFNKNEEPNIKQKPEYNTKDIEYYFHKETENPFLRNLDCNVIHNKFYKRDFLINNNLYFNEKVSLGEDGLFCWMSFIKTNTVAVDKNIYYYHRVDIETSLMGSSSQQRWFDNHMRIIDYLIKHQDEFKFEGHKEWILNLAINYGMKIFEFGSDEEKSENAKLFFSTVDNLLDKENVIISQDASLNIKKIKQLIKD